MAREERYAIVDVQWPNRYEASHIPGAINVPLYAIGEDGVPELPDRDQMIFVYDYFSNRSREAAQRLADLGYTQVVEFGGLFSWTGALEGTDADEYEYEYDDDPFEAREYSDPEDFYYDSLDEFDDYDEAEDYFYEHGDW